VPVVGNGDGVAVTDAGTYERQVAASSTDTSQPSVPRISRARERGTSYPAASPVGIGPNVSYTDWTHGSYSTGTRTRSQRWAAVRGSGAFA
jgi:hypothetical protein